MVSLPVGYNILLLLAAVLAGVCECRRLAARGVHLAMDGVVKQSAALYLGVPLVFLCLLAFLVFTAVVPLPRGWYLPLWLSYYRETLMWGTLLVLGRDFQVPLVATQHLFCSSSGTCDVSRPCPEAPGWHIRGSPALLLAERVHGFY